MDLVFSYATSLELKSRTGSTPSANSEIDSKFLEQSIANTLSGAKTFRVSTPLSVGDLFKKTFNLTELSNIKHLRGILVKSSQLTQVKITTSFSSASTSIQTFKTKFCFIDLDEPASGYQSAITQSIVELTNLSSSLSAEVTLIVVGY